MLAIQSATGPQSPDMDSVTVTATSESADVPIDEPTSPTHSSTTAASRTLFVDDSDRIQELLEDVQPRTWVFTGDNLGFQIEQARRGWIEHFSDFVREKVNRKQDIILNSSFADSSIEHILKDIEWRVLRFQPDIVLVMLSADECANDGEDDEFRDRLQHLTERLHDEGCAVVLNTPPCPADASPSTTKSMKTGASRIRSVATATGAVLADHFSLWLAAIQHDRSNANLHGESGKQPSARGHRELARRLLKSLNIRTA
jgi:lysophospholipase L1-like esterase